jgi:hypothetical protein
MVGALPRFPKVKPQRDVAGRHYLTKAEINALRHLPDEASARLEPPVPRRSVLAMRVGRVLQLRC